MIKLKLVVFMFFLIGSTPIFAAVYNVTGGTLTLNDFVVELTSTGGTLNINEGDNAYQGLGEIFDGFSFRGDVDFQTAASVGDIVGGNAPSGNVIDGGTIDMSAFFVDWNGDAIYQGNDAASVSAIEGGYQIAWQSGAWQVAGSPPITVSTYWTMNIAAVPLPAAMWLFGGGLIGLISVARRKN